MIGTLVAGAGSYALGAGAALYSASTWALGSQLFGRALERRPELRPDAANLFKNSLACSAFILLAMLLRPALPALPTIAPLLASGLLGFALGDALYFAAFRRCGVQLAALTATLIPPLAGLLDYFVNGTAIPLAAIACMLLSLVGIGCVVNDPRLATTAHVQPSRRDRWIGLALGSGAALSQALAIVTGRVGFEGVGETFTAVLPGTVLRLGGGVIGAPLLALVFYAWSRRRADRTNAQLGSRDPNASPLGVFQAFSTPALGRALVIPATVAAVINLPAHSLAIASLPAAVSAILFATTPLFTLPIGLFMGSRYGPSTWIGTLLAFAGVAGVIYFSYSG